MPLKVFSTCDLGPEALAQLRGGGLDLEVYPGPHPPSHAELLEAVTQGVDGLLTTLRDPVDRTILEAGRGRLRVVAQCAVGLDNIDIDAATDAGIVVTHTPDVLTAATAEFALFSLGALARRLLASEAEVRDGHWKAWHPYLPFLGREVAGMTIGVIGLGRIGRAFAARCIGLEVDLLLHDPNKSAPDFIASLDALLSLRAETGVSARRHSVSLVDLETLLQKSDAISLHVPLRETGPRPTRHLIDAQALSRMKRGVLLVNTSRGPVIDEIAVADALRRDHLGGAALDVFAQEPLPLNSPLLSPDISDRLRLSHHFASGTGRTRLSPDPDIGMAGRAVAGLVAGLGLRLPGAPGGNSPRPHRENPVDPRQLPYCANPAVRWAAPRQSPHE